MTNIIGERLTLKKGQKTQQTQGRGFIVSNKYEIPSFKDFTYPVRFTEPELMTVMSQLTTAERKKCYKMVTETLRPLGDAEISELCFELISADLKFAQLLVDKTKGEKIAVIRENKSLITRHLNRVDLDERQVGVPTKKFQISKLGAVLMTRAKVSLKTEEDT